MSSHHRHRSRRGLAYAVVFTLLLAAALFPEACVGFAETRLLAAAAWVVAAAGLLYPAHHRRKPFATPRALLACLALLALWSVFQLLPLPASLLPLLWRGTAFPDRAAILSDVVSRAGGALALAVEPHRTFHALLLRGGLAALALAAAKRLRTSAARHAVLHGIVVLALAEAAYALFSREPGMPRLRGSFANADALGGLLAIALPLALGGLSAALAGTGGRLRGTSPRHAAKAALFLLAGVLLLLALFFTGSRGAALAAALALAGMLLLQWKENALLRRPIALFLAAAVALFALFLVNAQRLHVLERATGEGALARATEARTSIWRAAADLARDFPFGTGADGTAAVLGIYQTPRFGRYRLDWAHNDFLQFLGDGGLPGMALLLLATGLLFTRAVRVSRAGSDSRPPWMMRGACAALAAAVVHSAVEFNLSARPALQLVFALLAGVVLAEPLPSARPAAAEGAAPP
ncbi:MAG: O-antigen ligase family protein, partial [Kiritimatiellae bacterium]|nr:O-antigen ligase family protein [Kiritimatiellia bacterium]